MEFNKLVRDNIPDIIVKNGRIPVTHTAEIEEFTLALLKKLREEVDEYIENPSEEEIVDVLEVLYAIFQVKGYDPEELERKRKEKLKVRGGFIKRTILDKTE